jgi:hypothetical protein
VLCAQQFYVPGREAPKLSTDKLSVVIDGQHVHLWYRVSSGTPRLESVLVERRAGGVLTSTVWFHDPAQTDFRQERYVYDKDGRLSEIIVHEMLYGAFESWASVSVIYRSDGNVDRVKRRKLNAGEASCTFDTVEVAEDEAPATAEQAAGARQRLERSLARAVVAWGDRLPEEVNRILLLHDWPSNPPLPPGLSARSDPLTSAVDSWELFDPDSSGELLDPDPEEFNDEQLRADCEVLNEWYEQSEGHNPHQLLVAVARRAQAELAQHRGHPVWVIPVDKDREALPAAVQELLPASVSQGLLLEDW